MDQYNCRMRQATAGSMVSSTIVGLNGSSISNTPPGADGQGLGARLYYPGPLFADSTGYWFTQPYTYSIHRISKGLAVTTIAGGTNGFVDGIGAAAKFGQPMGIAADAYGNVYVADGGAANAVRLLTCKACPAGMYCSSRPATKAMPWQSAAASGAAGGAREGDGEKWRAGARQLQHCCARRRRTADLRVDDRVGPEHVAQ
jgi:hypothetical protein